MNDFERLVQAEIGRLRGPEFPDTPRARRMRDATIRALAEAAVANQPWTGEEGVLGPKRPALIVGEKNFYEKKHWNAHPLTREVIENVTRLFAERDAAEREQARQEKRDWLENRELEAAEQQFDKAGDLLRLPHLVKTLKKPGADGKEVTILDPANAAVFNAAAKLNVTASDLARRALGLPTQVQRSELTGAEGGPIAMRDGLDEVDDDELQRRIGAMARGALLVIGGQRAIGGPLADDEEGDAFDDPEGEE